MNEPSRFTDIYPPEGTSFEDYTVDEITDEFAALFEEYADDEAEFYLGDEGGEA